MYFDIVGEIRDIQSIAAGRSIREVKRLGKRYGKARWRKLKGVADIRLTVYPEDGHDSWTHAYTEPTFYDWLLQHGR